MGGWPMIRGLLLFLAAWMAAPTTDALAQQKAFHVLALYSKKTEADHVQFAQQAIAFFTEISVRNNFELVASDRWDDLNATDLLRYQVILWLNDSPQTEEQRRSFERYMEQGGGWFGFHASGYNDTDTHWPWFVDFLGGAVFYGNSWPPLPAKLHVDDLSNPVTKGMPETYLSPANEWYIWDPDPRDNPNVKVLLTLDPSNYPLGLKDVLEAGDLPVVWTNTRYKMLYMNMGHGDKIFQSPVQNRLFTNSLLWLGASGNAKTEALHTATRTP
jgi:uncharacterized protein